MEYSATITVEAAAALTEDLLFDLAELGGAASGDLGGRTATVTFTVDAGDIATAGRIGLDQVLAIVPGAHVVAVEVLTADEADRRIAKPPFAELAGIAEIADMLGVSRQRASALQTRQGFPAPVAVLRSGPVWRRGDLSRFADDWTRRPGRPAKVS